MTRQANSVRRAIRGLLPKRDYVKFSGSIIPAPDRRWCGPEFKDDHFYVASAEREAQRLVSHFQCTRRSRVLDVGCGQGRLAIGMLRIIGDVDYMGLDVDNSSIDWCRRFIGRKHHSFKFKHLDIYNERYNKTGTTIGDDFHFDLKPRSFDIIYLFSVFSHTTEYDMVSYIKDFSRILDENGRVFFTAFVEDDVPDISVNPENYQVKCSGPLHVVRYRKDYLFSTIDESGYSIAEFTHGTEADGQSALYLSKK